MNWPDLKSVKPKSYKCSYCGNLVSSSHGTRFLINHKKHIDNLKRQLLVEDDILIEDEGNDEVKTIYICPHCQNPTFFNEDIRVPDIILGNDVLYLPVNVDALYQEARRCASVSAYTGSILLCRKLLMNIAVSLDAPEGRQFIFYVDYLAEKGYIPPNGRVWVDHIRKKGNEATHEIALMTKKDAEELVSFAEMLMKFVYKFPNRIS